MTDRRRKRKVWQFLAAALAAAGAGAPGGAQESKPATLSARVAPHAQAVTAELAALDRSLRRPRPDLVEDDLACLVDYLAAVQADLSYLNRELSRRNPARSRQAMESFCEEEPQEDPGPGTEAAYRYSGDSVRVEIAAVRRADAETVALEMSVTNRAPIRALSLAHAVLVDGGTGALYRQSHISKAPNGMGKAMVGAGETITGTIAFRVPRGRIHLALHVKDAYGDEVKVPLHDDL